MENFLWSTTFKLPKISRSWYDRESTPFCLEHGYDDDEYREYDESYSEWWHIKIEKINTRIWQDYIKK